MKKLFQVFLNWAKSKTHKNSINSNLVQINNLINNTEMDIKTYNELNVTEDKNPFDNSTPLYLYLEKPKFVDNWINGAEIPLFMASKYKSNERKGIETPDELIQSKINGVNSHEDYELIKSMFGGPQGGMLNNQSKNITIKFNQLTVKDGHSERVVGKNISIEKDYNNALIFCLSTKLCRNLSNKLNKSFCIEIMDFNKLKCIMDDQIGEIGTAKHISYTKDLNRNEFLKSDEDEWQQEFRIVWKGVKNEMKIKIPGGLCREIMLK